MNRKGVLFVGAISVAAVLWLALAVGSLDLPVTLALPVQLQSGQYSVSFQQGVVPSGYGGAADSYMDYYEQTAKWGGRTNFTIASDDKKRALIRFELADHIPAGAHVLSATLSLRVESRSVSTPIGLVPYLIRQPWSEGEVSWQLAQTGVAWWGGPGCEGDSRSATPIGTFSVGAYPGGTVALDLTTAVQAWVDNPTENHGLLLQGQQVGTRVNYTFVSSDNGTPSYRPRLEVVYEGAPPLATPTPTLTPTRTPTPPNPTTVTSSLSDWKFDLCMKTNKDWQNPPRVLTSPVETMVIMWEGTVYTAKLRLVICNSNPNAQHPIYLNGHLVGRTPRSGTTGCECNQLPVAPELQFEFEIPPSVVLQGANYISVTNEADPYDEWKASRAEIILVGDISGTTRSGFPLGFDWLEQRLWAQMQEPIGYDPAVPTPLLISIPGTGEDKIDALNRFAVQANQMGWLLASLDMRHVRLSDVYRQLARSPWPPVQRDVMDLVRYMQQNYNVDPSRVYIAGFSTGGGIAATMAAKYPDVFAGALNYSGPTDYRQWYTERPDIKDILEREFGTPINNFEYPRRSSRMMASNLQYVAMRLRHSATGDTSVPFAHATNLFLSMAQYYDPAVFNKELITGTVGHVDPSAAARQEDLQYLSRFSRVTKPREIHVFIDEGKSYYWVRAQKVGLADDSWRGWVELDARYDPGTGKIWLRTAEGNFADGKPLTITFDLIWMGLDSAVSYDIEEYDAQTGQFFVRTVSPSGGLLVLNELPNALGGLGRQYVIYPSRAEVVGYARLRQGEAGYTGVSDTYIVSDQFPAEGPSTPHGDATVLNLGCDARRKALVYFDLSSIPNDVAIRGARLTLHLLEQRTVSLNIHVFEALRSWSANEATWSLAASAQPWFVAGVDGIGNDRKSSAWAVIGGVQLQGAYSFNAKALVEQWLAEPASNRGLVLIGEGVCASSTKYPLGSAENGDSSKRPLLEIWYMDPEPEPTVTPTPTSTLPASAAIQGSVTLQRRAEPPHPSWSVPLIVTVDGIDHAVISDDRGMFTLSGLAAGTYDINVKSRHTLRNRKSQVTLMAGNTQIVDFGTLLAGDANDDNCVDIMDFYVLKQTFNTSDIRADFDQDGIVNIYDFYPIKWNFNRCGDIEVE